MDAIKADCRTDYMPASRTSGTRKLNDVLWVVIHDTEGGTAYSNARYFHNPALPEDGGPEGSAHLTVDDNRCYRCLPNTAIPWAAPDANTNGFHIEQAGYAHWTRAEWLAHGPMLRRAAFKAAYHCHLFKLSPVFRDAAALRNRLHGVTTHAQVTLAFPGPGRTHTDPGAGWPQDRFMEWVNVYYSALGGI